MNPHDSHSPTVRLTATYVDECLEQGRPEMEWLKVRIARPIKECLQNGATEAEVAAALHLFVSRRTRNAWRLAELLVEIAQDQDADPTSRPSMRKRTQEWINEHGWPTGARFVRGTHAGAYVYDPLGLDKIVESDWPYRRPSFDDVARALAAA